MKKHFAIFLIVLAIFPKGKLVAQTGIGTTSPVNKLQVEGASADPFTSGSSANGILRLSGTTGIHVLDMGVSFSSTYGWIQARSESGYGTNYNLLLNPNGGNVGIGTTTPTARLNLVGGGIRIHNGFSNASTRPAVRVASGIMKYAGCGHPRVPRKRMVRMMAFCAYRQVEVRI